MAGMGDIFGMMKNARQMLDKAKSAQGDLAKKTATGSAGADMVVATVNGLGELIGLKFEPSAITPDDPDMLAELIIAAVADARRKIAQMRGEAMKDVTGGLDLSSLGLDPAGMM